VIGLRDAMVEGHARHRAAYDLLKAL